MARSEARLLVDIWQDPDFRALTAGAQRAFMFLLSQPDLAHDGTIALREGRWARAAEGLTVEQLATELDELAAARFVVLDRDEQELLVRSFIRRDKVYRQPNVLRAAADHLSLVSSAVIRHAIAVELARIEDAPESSAATLAEMKAALPNPSENPSPTPSPKGSPRSPGERGVVTVVTTEFPVPLSPNPETPQGASTRARSRATRIPDDFEPSPELIAWARTHAPTAGRADHEAFMDHWRAAPGQKGVKADWPATWRNWMRREHERRSRNGARASPPSNVIALPGTVTPSTTDIRMAQAIAAGEQLAARLHAEGRSP